MEVNERILMMKEELGINRVIIIDDGFKKKDDYEVLYDKLQEYKTKAEFQPRKELMKAGFSLDEANEILSDQFEINSDNRELNKKIQSFLTDKKIIGDQNKNGLLYKFRDFIVKTFGEITTQTLGEIGQVCDIKNNDLFIVDYDLDEHETVTGDEILNQVRELLQKETNLNLQDENEIFKITDIYYVLFMSSKKDFILEENSGDRAEPIQKVSYSLIKPSKKNEYFRKLREKYKFYHCVVFNYLNKDQLVEDSVIENELFKIFNEFKLTRMFFDFLNSLYKQISLSKSEVFKDFYSLNLKTIKSVIDEEIQQEGIAEFKFFNDLICNLISKKNTGLELIKEISSIVDNIKNLDELTEEPYLDLGLVDIRKKEIYEEVSHTYAPIDFGDIFKLNFNDYPQHILLISQQCDLAIRQTGKRNCKNAILLRDYENNSCGIEVDRYELNNDESETKKYYWDKVNPLTLPCEILDLTTLNIDGNSKIYLDADVEQVTQNLITEGHRQYMKEVYKILLDKVNENETAIRNVDDNIKDKYRIINVNENYVRYLINQENKEVYFGIKRIHRLDMKVAYKVQQEYTNVLNRIGQNLDIANLYKEKKANINLNEKKCTSNTINLMLVKNANRRDHILVDYNSLVNEIVAISKTYGFYDFGNLLTKLGHFATTSAFNISSKKNEFIKLTANHLLELRQYGLDIDISGRDIDIKCNTPKAVLVNGQELKPGSDFIVKNDKRILFINIDVLSKNGLEINLKTLNPENIYTLKGVTYINILDRQISKQVSFNNTENSLGIELKLREKEGIDVCL